jgi:hypothetical protein
MFECELIDNYIRPPTLTAISSSEARAREWVRKKRRCFNSNFRDVIIVKPDGSFNLESQRDSSVHPSLKIEVR